ncbi:MULTISPECIES: GNAT family N-acetyltransferase [Streptomyces]|jgi:Acetyltransferases|uniref:DNA mismatch repair protein MutT n=3 Tax=Streptomyces TaxID=1883 RepID=A0A1Y2NZS6_STRFR|nr:MULTISPECIES: GNAT family N-acetyltransferase [Streptomyces]AOT59614.1 putative acetyltransferase [Streptomyces rubrolavendulae]KAF0651096.1 DNA mismatch repair protein MutT [Streptomyces fradiae ATCC 10745 = DSM 40063]OSY53014.1 putative acetyltransferase [Streptomyces fradiae ATCC 10745 = DSM 40063]QEV12848.1 GNAT family N-acetyltransferase [Streptomyces fradiae ATCC 10745 = DSM 40063]UQS31894.1 GNAT family N-acetyltransferase [Streptomyces fradiae]
MIVEPLEPGEEGALPGPLLTELTELYASNREFQQLSGEFPDPDDIRPEQVAASLADELAQPGAEVLVARSAGRVIGIAVTLAHHPDPDDPDPWIGLLMVHGRDHRMGFGRELTEIVEKRFRALGRTGVKLAVLDNNRKALSFWRSLGYAEVARRRDLRLGRDCVVLRKPL